MPAARLTLAGGVVDIGNMSAGGIYCLGCFYDLRNLPVNRCPECGRFFDPADPRTYSPKPNPERLLKLMNRAGAMLSEWVTSGSVPAHFGGPSLLVRQYSELARETAELREFVFLLVGQMIATGVLAPEEFDRLRAEARVRAATEELAVDDTAEPSDDAEEEPDPELLELKQAAEDLQRRQGE